MLERFDLAIAQFKHCQELNPNGIPARMSCALGFAFADAMTEATDLVDATFDVVDELPQFLWGYVQNIWYLDGNLSRCIEAGERSGDKILNLPAWQSAALWETGRTEDATETAREFLSATRAIWTEPLSAAGPMWLIGLLPAFLCARRRKNRASCNP